jgi:hypothetical protein
MKWITRSHVHVDRVACPWLIKRFVDSAAEFIFAAAESISERAVQENATPFDVKGVELGHHGGKCSFDAIMDKYKLSDPALFLVAEVVNAADTNNLTRIPYAAGLEAMAQGFSLMYPDDYTNIEKQFSVYDALYAFFRLEIAKKKNQP